MVTLPDNDTCCEHDAELSGAWPVLGNGAPSIIQRTDEDFIPALLEELAGQNPAAVVPNYRPAVGDDGFLRLFQPVHRTFNLALLEAHCVQFGTPRLDPQKIDSSGLVVRRVRIQSDGTKVYDAWCATKSIVAGWTVLPPIADPDHLRDPDPTRRPQPRLTADPAFDRERFGPPDRTAETYTSLFVGPPETIAATGRTLLYGVIPVTSSSHAGPMAKGNAPSASDWADHLSILLQTYAYTRTLWPSSTGYAQHAHLDRADLKTGILTLSDGSSGTNATRFVLLVRQLAQEFNLLRPVNPETVLSLIAKLNSVTIELVDSTTRPAGDYLVEAATYYFDQTKPATAPRRPKTWPAISATLASDLFNLLQQISGETELSIFSTQNGGGRYDDLTAHYVIRAFIRVKQPCDCPPKIVWSPYSEEFSIAAWFDSGPNPPVPIILPDLTPDFFKKARPSVAFSVPAKLANVLNQDPKKFLDGTAGQGSGFTLDWICGFNIPIITICAFIVLNIMLSLLNIIFFWLPFVKICIPFPRKK